MAFYRGVESAARREELFTSAHELKTWLRIRRDIIAAGETAASEFIKQHPKKTPPPPVHVVIPHVKRAGDNPTQLTEWTIPIRDVLEVCSRRISLYTGNLSITKKVTKHGLEMPEEDVHGKQLVQRIREQVQREEKGKYFPVKAEVIHTPTFLQNEVTAVNSDPGDVLYWTVLWGNYLNSVLMKQAQQRRGTTATIWINAPESVHDYGFRWQRKKKLTFDWQTIKMLQKVIEKIETEMVTRDPLDYQRVKDRIEMYYELLHDEQVPPQQPEGLFPSWLYYLPDIINIAFLPKEEK